MPDQLEFIDGEGNAHWLTHPDFMPQIEGATGRFMPDFDIKEDIVPFQPGTRPNSIYTGFREVFVPVLLVAPNETVLKRRIRDMSSYLDPDLGIGKLRSTDTEGAVRILNCTYSDSWQGEEGENKRCVYYLSGLTFHAFDPYWYDPEPTIQTLAQGANSVQFFGSPFLPVKLNKSQLNGSLSILNFGDIAAFPIWRITGPGSNLVLTYPDGRVLAINTSLGANDELVIDTRPGQKTVMKNGVNIYEAQTLESVMLPMKRGQTKIVSSMTGTGEGSSISIEFTQGYNCS